MDDYVSRVDEISAIKSIYEEEEIFNYDEENRCGKIFVKYESHTQFELNLSKFAFLIKK